MTTIASAPKVTARTKQENLFKEYVRETYIAPRAERGEEINALYDVHCTTEEAQEGVWNWFGDHGAFCGGAPMTEGYCAEAMVAPATTPFRNMLYVSPTHTGRQPLVAIGLRRGWRSKGRLHDAMEMISGGVDDSGHEDGEVMIFSVYNGIPEPSFSSTVEDVMREFGKERVQVWV